MQNQAGQIWETQQRENDTPDRDLQAVQSLMREEEAASAVLVSRIGASANQPALDDTPAHTRDDTEIQHSLTAKIWRFAYLKLTGYRPERRVILWTSLLCLLLIRPGLVIGWTLFAAMVVLLCYLFMGPDRFWWQIITFYRRLRRRRPQLARSLKCRAYILARRWDSLLELTPQGLADTLRSPDLRGMIAADQRHDSVMSDRLTRLDRDATVR